MPSSTTTVQSSPPATFRLLRRVLPPCPAPSTSTTAIANTAKPPRSRKHRSSAYCARECGSSGPTPTATSTLPTRSTTGPISPCPTSTRQFYTDSYQPFAEYEFHVTPQFNITAGSKFATYTYDVIHKADDGKTVGNLCPLGQTTGCPATATDTGTFYRRFPRSISTTASRMIGRSMHRVQPAASFRPAASTTSTTPPRPRHLPLVC